MSAAPALALEKTQRRVFPRHPISVPLDLIVLRSGVPQTLPGRCTDLSEAGVGAIVAGELDAGQPVAVELRLPNVGVPFRARALVRYQSRLRCGLELVGLQLEQREMIRYWIDRWARKSADSNMADSNIARAKVAGAKPFDSLPVDANAMNPGATDSTALDLKEEKLDIAQPDTPAQPQQQTTTASRRIRIGRRGFYWLILCLLAIGALAWWQWQRSWSELEVRTYGRDFGLHAPAEMKVAPETMAMRIVTKVDPVYPENARSAGTEGLVVLDAVIAPDGSVKSVRPVAGPSPLVQSATDAVRSWKFEPYLSNGKPIEVETSIAVEFRLN
ncbi:MAG: TonB family protein [Terriglobales bacterium]|jgi:TonB family protein